MKMHFPLHRRPSIGRCTGIAALFCAASVIGPAPAFSADGATLVLREGQIVRTNYGFKEISEAFRKLGSKDQPSILQLTIEGGSFLINLADVAIVCRDDCPSLTVEDPRQTKSR